MRTLSLVCDISAGPSSTNELLEPISIQGIKREDSTVEARREVKFEMNIGKNSMRGCVVAVPAHSVLAA